LSINILTKIKLPQEKMIQTYRVDDDLISCFLGQQVTINGDFLYEHLMNKTFRSISISSDDFSLPLLALETIEYPLPDGFTFTYLSTKRINNVSEVGSYKRRFETIKSIYIYQDAQQMDNQYFDTALFDDCIRLVGVDNQEILFFKDDSSARFITLVSNKDEIEKYIKYYDLRKEFHA